MPPSAITRDQALAQLAQAGALAADLREQLKEARAARDRLALDAITSGATARSVAAATGTSTANVARLRRAAGGVLRGDGDPASVLVQLAAAAAHVDELDRLYEPARTARNAAAVDAVRAGVGLRESARLAQIAVQSLAEITARQDGTS